MKTTYRSIALQSGQALALDRHRSARLVVAEGEVLLHAPAQWIGETLLLAPPRRIAAPAAVTCQGLQSLTAVGAAKLHVEERASPLALLGSAWQDLRSSWLRAPRLSRE
jgi:hypothetical protein